MLEDALLRNQRRFFFEALCFLHKGLGCVLADISLEKSSPTISSAHAATHRDAALNA